MKKTVLMLLLLGFAAQAQAFECNECHSKNPAMVRMHQALKGKNCFDCHKIGEKLMGKGVPRNREAQMQRRTTDPLCVSCHKQ